MRSRTLNPLARPVTYHLSRNGQPTGTCSKEEAVARYSRGEILPTDLVWCEGMANWTPASQVFGPVPSAAPVTAPLPTASTPLPPPVNAPTTPKPSNYLVMAILVTLLCCLPAGVVAIIYAAQVDGKWNAGDYAGAEASSKNAKLWSLVSLGVGLVGILAYVGFMLVAGVAAGASGNY